MIAIEPLTKVGNRNVTVGQVKICGPKTARRIERCITYMEQHLNQPLQVAELAAQAGVTTSYFFDAFKRRMGCTPKDYFTRLRMQRACQLLENNLLNVKEVAAQLGYCDPLYFSRVFKSVNGVAPTDYRTAWRGLTNTAIENRGGIQILPTNMNLLNT